MMAITEERIRDVTNPDLKKMKKKSVKEDIFPFFIVNLTLPPSKFDTSIDQEQYALDIFYSLGPKDL